MVQTEMYSNTGPCKILHIISGDLWAGAEVQVYHTLSFLNRDKKIELVCILFNSGILKEKLEGLNIKTIVLDESKGSSFSLLHRLIRAVHEIKPHLIHVHRIKEHLFSKISSMVEWNSVPIVRTVHGSRIASRKLPLIQFLKSSFSVKLDNVLIKYFADAIIAVSKDMEREFINLKVRGNLYQIYNSVNTENLICDTNTGEIRKRYGAENLFWIGTAVRLVEVKNLPMLIEAGKHLEKNNIPFKISIFGEGPLKKELQECIENNNLVGKVELRGFEYNIEPIIKSLDVFVLSSHHEGLPMSLLEAMILKTPIVCTSVGGMAEIINDGVNGLLVPSNDSRSLAEALIKIYGSRDMALRLTENARKTIEDDFSLSQTTESLCNIYRQLIYGVNKDINITCKSVFG